MRCDSYIQTVWATTRQIGCAYHYCDPLNTRLDPYPDAEYLACNYVPAGNVKGQKPFKKGPPCSQCKSGVGWCKHKLCVSQCLKGDENCSCQAVCHNCGTVGLNLSTCRCSCAKGWTGPDCSERCEDGNKLCKPDPNAKAGKCKPVFAAELAKLDRDDNGSHHQQQCTIVALLSNVILSLTITWKALH